MKLILENWRKFVKEEKVDPRMKKYLKDHPYMEPDGLQEKKWEDYEIGKDEWFNVPVEDIRQAATEQGGDVNIAGELFNLIDTAYKSIGGHIRLQKPQDLPGKYDDYLALDIDDDSKPDVLRINKGKKLAAGGHDGSKKAIKKYLEKTAEMFFEEGFYGEVSKGLAHMMIKYYSVPSVDDEETVRKVLGKEIEWIGPHPDGEYKGYEGWYIRDIGGKQEMKILVGKPNV
tara:strand:- start:694 stop:1380 length:687 start_codon:yes stop_codon:yes gene_type:complete